MGYNKINNLFGWICFLIAAITYILTLEQTASFWDCGEFIAAAFKLQIVHQPGAPLFLMIQKVFSLLAANVHLVAYWMNVGSALSSALTILFLFWTITALAKKIFIHNSAELTTDKLIIIMGSGVVGALAYTFSDTFWFSAVESEVYAMSSLCTAIVFWAVFKWEAQADEPHADRWLVFIAYVMGLSIGVHLLNLLAIPAIAIVYYFRRSKAPTTKGTLVALFAGIVIVAIVQYGIIQYLVKFAAYSDLLFVNTLGFGFGSGVTVFAILVVAVLLCGIIYTHKPSKAFLLITVISFLLAFIIGSGFTGLIVAVAILAILEYIIRIRNHKAILNLSLIIVSVIILGYSSFAMIVIRAKADPTLNNSDPDNVFALLSYLNREQYGDRPLLYGPYFDSKAIDVKEGDYIYRKGKDKYEVAGKRMEYIYDRNTLFPRMYSDDQQHIEFYREWMQMSESESPTFVQNVGFFFSYQLGFMYSRYMFWNFIGRQNDDQGHGNNTSGNWISGVKPLDALRLGSQENLPQSIVANKAYNRLFFLPFILGVIGAFWHFKRNQKDAGVVGLLFFFTGVAIVLYLNQNPLQPRERDYAYAGSFYAFAIWIGLGVAGISDFLKKKISPVTGGVIAGIIGLLAAPVIMASQEWNDHNRSTKFTTRDFAADYLESCAPNAILFTYGDNDTYPLWYAQEVEGIRTDVRVVNLSLLGTDWYIRQMKKKVNNADGLPLTMDDDKYVQGVRDMIRFNDYAIPNAVELKNVFDILVSDNDNDKVTMQDGTKENFLPTKKLKITINPDQVIATNTIKPALRDSIAKEIEWTYNRSYVSKTELAMFDLLAHNDWKRPIYFAVTVPSSNFIGLDKYLYNEGFAYRLLPLKTTPDSSANQEQSLNLDAMYNNLINKFTWGNMKNASYLDPESTRMIAIVIKSFNQIAEGLYNQGKIAEAKIALNKSLAVVPDQNYQLYFILHRFYTCELLYRVNETEKANKLVTQTADYIEGELNYIASSQSTKNANTSDVQLGMSVLNELIDVTKTNKQQALNSQLQNKFKALESKFFAAK